MKVRTDRFAEGHLNSFMSDPDLEKIPDVRMLGIRGAFRGAAFGRLLSVQAADNGSDVIFRNRELLTRFCLMTLEEQSVLLGRIRKILNDQKKGVVEARITVDWGKYTQRIVSFRKFNNEDGLVVDLT